MSVRTTEAANSITGCDDHHGVYVDGDVAVDGDVDKYATVVVSVARTRRSTTVLSSKAVLVCPDLELLGIVIDKGGV